MTHPAAQDLPCPPWGFDGEISGTGDLDLRFIPTAPGIASLEDDAGRVVSLVRSADIRRLVRTRLQTDDVPSRRADLRAVTRRVRAMTVGSTFEADWAWLQLARRHLPGLHRSLLDHWQAWFIECRPDADHPRWTKTAHPRGGGRDDVVTVGPFADKHVAARFIETLIRTFDLCRYHHLLIQSPDASACAYKEMGRCPAPCDGTVTLESYREQVRASATFATTAHADWVAGIEADMQSASTALDFERAEHLKRRLDDATFAGRPQLKLVDAIEAFKYVAAMPSDDDCHARLFVIRGGWIEPVVDVRLDADAQALGEVIESLHIRACGDVALGEAALENIGLVCSHLFKPTKRKSARVGRIVRLDDATTVPSLRKLIRAVTPDLAEWGDEEVESEPRP